MYQYDNYYTDHRVIAGESSKWYRELNEKTMTALFEDPETDEVVEVSFHYDVCPTCDGKGTHVNPSIDCNGLNATDFYDDPDFVEDYCRGVYDVPCYECNGNRVVPVSDDPRVIQALKLEAEYQAERAAERRMGA